MLRMVEKTLYLLTYVQDEAYRRRILGQFNHGEGRHAVARAIFHGKKGELRQRYREGMEDQVGTLGLVVNALVLWNTRYLQPLVHEHVNMLGRYDFTLPERAAAGELRPLRNSADWQERLADFS